MTISTLRDIITPLQTSASALAALGAALDARATGVALEPALQSAVDAVVDALGARDAIAAASAAELRPVLGEIRTYALSNAKLLFAASRGAGWAHTEPALLQAAGDVSTGFPSALAATIAPQLDGLETRLATAGAAFLDVGTGVGALAIEMARRWPHVDVVGIEPWAPAVAIARDQVVAAGLTARIEIRAQAGEDLADDDRFDLAWIPGVFVPGRALPAIVRRVRLALHPGGWLIVPFLRPVDDPLTAALARLRAAMFGGDVSQPATLEALLRDAGLTDVRTLIGSPLSPTAMVVGRRPT